MAGKEFGIKEASQAGDVITGVGAWAFYELGWITAATASTAVGLSLLTFFGAEYIDKKLKASKQ